MTRPHDTIKQHVVDNVLLEIDGQPFEGFHTTPARSVDVKHEFKPPLPEDREDGLELLTFWRGKWTHVKWVTEHGMWSRGVGEGFVDDHENRLWAPLPAIPDRDLRGHFLRI